MFFSGPGLKMININFFILWLIIEVTYVFKSFFCGNLKILLRANNTEAAFELAPPKPDLKGIFFLTSILIFFVKTFFSPKIESNL